jgi:membrane-associated phospholipid phosphatase
MRTFFRIISGIFHPMLLPFFGTILLFQVGIFRMYPLEYQLYIEGIVLLNMGILPSLAIFLLMKNGHISDLDVSVRNERIFPYLISLITCAGAVFLLIRFKMPWIIVKLFMGSVLATLIAFLITLKWKISAHAIAFGCIIASSFLVCFNQGYNPMFYFIAVLLLAGLQGTSRVYLGAHSVGQVAAGSALGFLSVCATYFLIP